MIPLIEYLQKHGLEKLATTYSIKVNPSRVFPELVCLSYDQLTTPKNSVTDDCRGIILNRDTLEIISYPFTRFNDYKVGDNKVLGDYFKVYDKIDGTLISMYWYQGAWRLGTKSTCDAHGIIPTKEISYAEYFWQVFNKLKYTYPSDKDFTYIFEFKFPSDIQFITKTDTKSITLIGARNNITRQEIHIETINNNWVKCSYIGISIEEVLERAKQLNPLENEGFVVCNANFDRYKVKSPIYDLIALLRSPNEDFLKNKRSMENNTIRLLQISQFTYDKSFLQYYEHCRDEFNKIISAKKQFMYEMSKLKSKLENLSGKDVGKVCKESTFARHAWQIQQSKDLEDFISKMDRKVYHQYLKKYLK